MANQISSKQIKILKENIDKMSHSDEQFIFILFKNPDGKDNITQYSFNTVPEKLKHYLNEAIQSGKLSSDPNPEENTFEEDLK